VAGLPAAGERLVGIAAEAAARARDAITRADLVLACRDAAADGGRKPPAAQTAIEVLTRCDLAERLPAGGGIATSSRTGRGIAELRAAILAAVARLARGGSPATLRLAVGCQEARAALAEAAAAVAAATAGAFVDESLVAAHLRAAALALADVTGADLGPDLLDRIFARHCIGK
jgi:tRNA modification GTPase